MLVCIDPGHGYQDPGAVNHETGDKEKDIVLHYGLELMAQLRDAGFKTIMTRSRDVYLPLRSRCKIANSGIPRRPQRSDLFISLHCNGFNNPEAHGWEVWTSPGETNADILATMIAGKVEAAFPGLRMRYDMRDGDPDKEAKFFVLMKTYMPAVLVELGFITNADDLKRMKDKRSMKKMVGAITKGVVEYAERE